MKFDLAATDGNARAGTIETSRSTIETPAFMPCASSGSIRGVPWKEMEAMDYQLILMNSLHLFLRPGIDVVEEFKGAHNLSTWNRSIITDSGGYQFFSLKGLYKIDEDGVSFQSPYDGSRHKFTPESVVEIQTAIGSDIMMPLDECAPGGAGREKFEDAGERTLRWLERAKIHFEKVAGEHQNLFGIVQGGTAMDLRTEYVERTSMLDLAGYAVGGVSVGEERGTSERVVEHTVPLMPGNKPRYLMGVGLPHQIIHGIEHGIDMFDCVLPTRMARNGTLFTSRGRVNMANSIHRTNDSPLDPDCACAACSRYPLAYLAHSHRIGDPGVLGLLSIHNLAYYRKIVREARSAIIEGTFRTWKDKVNGGWESSDEE
ncbi:MAG TPA: tRNA guanosine(34) transglycosylase Tgt [bacterium]